jgi:hypothetical protein
MLLWFPIRLQAQWQVVPLPGRERKGVATPHWIDDKYGQKVPLFIFDWWRHSSEAYSPRINSVFTLCWCHLWQEQALAGAAGKAASIRSEFRGVNTTWTSTPRVK